MRTTEVRQLLPDAWGFICPVHTPDGGPCGLLNHLTVNCVISKQQSNEKIQNIEKYLIMFGMIPYSNIDMVDDVKNFYKVILEGRLIGYTRDNDTPAIINKLRMLKVKNEIIDHMTEIVLIPKKKVCSLLN